MYPIKNQEAQTVPQKLVSLFLSSFTLTKEDSLSQIDRRNSACNTLGIKKTHTTPYHPQGNGMVERFNRILLDMLATTSSNHPDDWEHYVCKVLYVHEPVDLMYESNLMETKTVSGYALQLKRGLHAECICIGERTL